MWSAKERKGAFKIRVAVFYVPFWITLNSYFYNRKKVFKRQIKYDDYQLLNIENYSIFLLNTYWLLTDDSIALYCSNFFKCTFFKIFYIFLFVPVLFLYLEKSLIFLIPIWFDWLSVEKFPYYSSSAIRDFRTKNYHKINSHFLIF